MTDEPFAIYLLKQMRRSTLTRKKLNIVISFRIDDQGEMVDLKVDETSETESETQALVDKLLRRRLTRRRPKNISAVTRFVFRFESHCRVILLKPEEVEGYSILHSQD